MAQWTSLLVYSAAALTGLVGLAEIVLAALVLRNLHQLSNDNDYSLGGPAMSSSDPSVPLGQNLVFDEPWVLVAQSLVWDVPRCELAAGAIACAFAVLTGLYTHARNCRLRNAASTRHQVAMDRTVTALLTVVCAAVVGLFIYIFEVTGLSEGRSHVYVQNALGGTAYDATPTWEVWTCSVAKYLGSVPGLERFQSRWETQCQLTVSPM